jgi:hypothetical protein
VKLVLTALFARLIDGFIIPLAFPLKRPSKRRNTYILPEGGSVELMIQWVICGS